MIAIVTIMMVFSAPSFGQSTRGATGPILSYPPIPEAQRMELMRIARDTWRFYAADVDPNTHLPMDNFGANGVGRYTSAANIGVYLWAVVAANDLGLVSRPQARSLIQATLTEVQGMKSFDGFLYQWYDTTTGTTIRNPGDINCSAETTPTTDNCFFVSAVDNGWYASGLIVVRQALPELASLVNSLMGRDGFQHLLRQRRRNRVQRERRRTTHRSDVRRLLRWNWTGRLSQRRLLQRSAHRHLYRYGPGPDAGQRLVAKLAGSPAAGPIRQLRGHRPGLFVARAMAMGGSWQDYADPQSHQIFHVWEGHYTYPGTTLNVCANVGGRNV